MQQQRDPRPTAAALDALAAAADEFLEEGFAWSVHEKLFNDTEPEYRREAMEKLLPKRQSPDGFYLWLQHLVWLEGIRDIAPNLQLTALEVQGLAVLTRARNRFQRTHPPCPYCGMANDEGEMTCHSCLKEINR